MKEENSMMETDNPIKEDLANVTPSEASVEESTPEISTVSKKRKARRIVKKIFLTFIAAVFALSFLLPTILTVTNSFMKESEIQANYGSVFSSYEKDEKGKSRKVYQEDVVNLKLIPDEVTLQQYETTLLKSPEYLMKFWNSVFLTVPIVIFQIIVALGAAYSFFRFRGKVKTLIFFIYLILMLMPYQVTLVPNYIVNDWMGILDTRWSIVLPGVFSPFSVYLLTKYMKRIPDEVIEAAQLDGANEWQLFKSIAYPLTKPAIASVAILVFIDYWNMVEQPLIMMTNSNYHPLSVFLSQINSGEIGVAFSIATIYMVPPILIFLYGEKYLVEGVTMSGSVK